MFEGAIRNSKLIALSMSLAIAVVAFGVLSGCQSETEFKRELTPQIASEATITEGTLTVGVNASNSPYGGTNASGETVGLDVDVAAAIADELGLKLQIVDVNSNGRAALSNKQVDIALGLTKSGSSKSVTYSPAYVNDGASLFCLAENAPSKLSEVQSSEGKVLVQANTAAAYTAQEALGASAIRATSTMQEAFEALVAGEEKYLVADAVIGDYFARNYEGVQRVNFISSENVTPIYAVTLTDNSELTSAVSGAFGTITQNGVLKVVSSKWLGTQAMDLLPGQVDIETLPDTAFGD